MSVPFQTPTIRDSRQHNAATIDSAPPTRSKVTGGLAVLACAAWCALPLLIAAGVLTTAGAAIVEKTLYAVAAGLVVAALSMWWLHRRRSARRAAAAGGATCGCGSAEVAAAEPAHGGGIIPVRCRATPVCCHMPLTIIRPTRLAALGPLPTP